MMAKELKPNETVPGGRYLSADGKTWHDAFGNVLPGDPLAAAESAPNTLTSPTNAVTEDEARRAAQALAEHKAQTDAPAAPKKK